MYHIINVPLGRCTILPESWYQKCERKNNERESRKNATPRIKNWPVEYHKRELKWFETIPENGVISYNEHQANFPYGPSVYRDTKLNALQVYKKFIKNNKIMKTYARIREATVQEKII